MNKNRTDKYSVLKGVLIYCVICTHTMIYFECLKSGNYSSFSIEILDRIAGLGVPFFLLLGGFFYAQKSKAENFFDATSIKMIFKNSILKRILVPYYIFTTAYMVKKVISGRDITLSNYFLLESQAHGLYYLVIYIYALVFFLFLGWLLHRVFCLSKKNTLTVIPLMGLSLFPVTDLILDYFGGNIIVKSIPLISFFQ